MTDEYFYIEEISPNSSEIECEKSADKKCSKAKERDAYLTNDKRSRQEIRLHGDISRMSPSQIKNINYLDITEIEQQLEMAESRCNTLKGQVDYMKMLYNGMNSKDSAKLLKNKPVNNRRHLGIDNGGKRKRNEPESDTVQHTDSNYNEEPPIRERDVDLHQYQTMSNVSTVPHRDRGEPVSHHGASSPCERDASAAVKSINNIISGITNSVNRLTKLQVNIGTDKSSTETGKKKKIIFANPIGIQNVHCSPRYTDDTTAAEKPYQIEATQNINSSDSMKSKLKKKRRLKGKTSKQSLTSNQENKRRVKVTAKHIEKKTKLNQSFTGADISQLTANRLKRKQFGKLRTISSRTLLMKRSLNSYGNKHNKLEKQEWKSDKLIELYHNSAAKIITASEDSLPNKKTTNKLLTADTKIRLAQPSQHSQVIMQPIMEKQENCQYRPPLSPINEQEIHYKSSYYKNYELPTIASKMKQVAKSYFQNFNFRTIPFVAAKSITPSHNLGVNIQQVLGIIKGKKPVAGISPTLAYNIELAANKLGSRPLSELVSSLGSRMYNNKNMCPLARKYPFSHLQEMAKEIPEETLEELNATYEEGSTKIPPAHVMAAGDKDIENNQDKIWYTDSKKNEKCTCLPKQGVSFNDVYNKYFSDDKIPNRCYTTPVKKIRYKPWNENRRRPLQLTENAAASSGSKCSQINKRERSLKEVLKNLHDEFATLTERYEELKGEVGNLKGSHSSSTLLLEIEKMERDLQNKEDEITMVMTLYKEVMALKQQVKVLKTRASQSSVIVSPFINRNRDYKDLNAAGHLTKLLRHIQQFQETLKNKSNR